LCVERPEAKARAKAQEHDPEKHALGPPPDGCAAAFRRDHAQSRTQSAMVIRPDAIVLYGVSSGLPVICRHFFENF
jgi:hypothetical protein